MSYLELEKNKHKLNKIGLTGHYNIEAAYNKVLLPNINVESYIKAEEEIDSFFKDKIVLDNVFVSGMARGIDEIFALYAIRKNVPLILVIPHSIDWHKNFKHEGKNIGAFGYDLILNDTSVIDIIEVTKEYNGVLYPNSLIARNQAMVDICNEFYSFKKMETNGVNDCIERAKKKGIYKGNICK